MDWTSRLVIFALILFWVVVGILIGPLFTDEPDLFTETQRVPFIVDGVGYECEVVAREDGKVEVVACLKK